MKFILVMDLFAAKSREAINFRTQCIVSVTSVSTATTSAVLELEKLQLPPLETFPNSAAADRSWRTSTSRSAMLELEKVPSLDTRAIPFVAERYVGAVGTPSEVGQKSVYTIQAVIILVFS